jgi:hypothetical protein
MEDLELKIHSLDLTKDQIIVIKTDEDYGQEFVEQVKSCIKDVVGGSKTKIGIMLLRKDDEIEIINKTEE